jgi:hypothetical protein
MIEVATYPGELKTWNPDTDRYYLELFGEGEPVIADNYAEIVPVGPVDAAVQTSQPAPVYEYWWTIGHLGYRGDTFWGQLEDPAARVYVYFPVWGGWRIKEIVAAVKYLSPTADQQSAWNTAAKEWQALQPIVADASQLALALGPAAGSAAGGAASLLSVIAKLQINTVPQTPGFQWSVGKVAYLRPNVGVFQGVTWTLPKKMFSVLGGRLTGSIALSFIPARHQGGDAASDPPGRQPVTLQRLPALAHAVVYGPDNEEVWRPAQDEYVELYLSPKHPTQPAVAPLPPVVPPTVVPPTGKTV